MNTHSATERSPMQPPADERQRLDLLQQIDRAWAEQEAVPFGRVPILGTLLRSLKRLLYLGEFESVFRQMHAISADQQQVIKDLSTHVQLLTEELRHTQDVIAGLTTHANQLTVDLRNTQQNLASRLDMVARTGPLTEEVERLRHELTSLPVSTNLILRDMNDRIDELANTVESSKREPRYQSPDRTLS